MNCAIRRHQRLIFLVLLFVAAFLYLAHIGSYHLIELDEGRYHRVAMEMALSGDYITPHFDYMPYFEKPIFQYWITALSMEIFDSVSLRDVSCRPCRGWEMSCWHSGLPESCTTAVRASWQPSFWRRRHCSSSSLLLVSSIWH